MTNNDPRPNYGPQSDVAMSGMSPAMTNRPTPSPMQSTRGLPGYGNQYAHLVAAASPAPSLPHQTSYSRSQPPIAQSPVQFPAQTPHVSAYGNSYSVSGNHQTSASVNQHLLGQYDQNYNRTQNTAGGRYSSNAGRHFEPPKSAEVFVLYDHVNASIPEDVRNNFHRDSEGRIIWYSAPPVLREKPTLSGGISGHSLRYLAKKARDEEILARKRKEREGEREEEGREKKRKIEEDNEKLREEAERLLEVGIKLTAEKMQKGTEALYRGMFGHDADKVVRLKEEQIVKAQMEQAAKKELTAKREREWAESQLVKIGRVGL